MDGMKVALGNRGMMEAARQCAKEQERVETPGTYVIE